MEYSVVFVDLIQLSQRCSMSALDHLPACSCPAHNQEPKILQNLLDGSEHKPGCHWKCSLGLQIKDEIRTDRSASVEMASIKFRQENDEDEQGNKKPSRLSSDFTYELNAQMQVYNAMTEAQSQHNKDGINLYQSILGRAWGSGAISHFLSQDSTRQNVQPQATRAEHTNHLTKDALLRRNDPMLSGRSSLLPVPSRNGLSNFSGSRHNSISKPSRSLSSSPASVASNSSSNSSQSSSSTVSSRTTPSPDFRGQSVAKLMCPKPEGQSSQREQPNRMNGYSKDFANYTREMTEKMEAEFQAKFRIGPAFPHKPPGPHHDAFHPYHRKVPVHDFLRYNQMEIPHSSFNQSGYPPDYPRNRSFSMGPSMNRIRPQIHRPRPKSLSVGQTDYETLARLAVARQLTSQRLQEESERKNNVLGPNTPHIIRDSRDETHLKTESMHLNMTRKSVIQEQHEPMDLSFKKDDDDDVPLVKQERLSNGSSMLENLLTAQGSTSRSESPTNNTTGCQPEPDCPVTLAKKNLLPASSRVSDWLDKIIHFAKSIPEFNSLPDKDKVTLLVNAWVRMLLLYMAEHDFEFAVTPSQVKSSDNDNENMEPQSSDVPTMSGVEQIQAFVQKCQFLGLDNKEYAFLRMQVLFHSGKCWMW